MWHPPTAVEKELWDAVVAGVRAVDQADRRGLETAVNRLLRLPPGWTHGVLGDTAGLLVEELVPDAHDLWPLLAAQVDRTETWLPEVDGRLLAVLLPGRRLPPATDVPGEPGNIRHRLLLIAYLADAAQVRVGAFVDVALAGASRRASRPLARSVPHSRVGN
ncbi:hypothetical protein V6U81_17530 [Micromonospora sp. CPCC 205711]|uniref:hypothetical protein n=1 Tax=Micromonospora sp. CPCC 205547 TaxID=3122400 RepID=UPI002FF0BC11